MTKTCNFVPCRTALKHDRISNLGIFLLETGFETRELLNLIKAFLTVIFVEMVHVLRVRLHKKNISRPPPPPKKKCAFCYMYKSVHLVHEQYSTENLDIAPVKAKEINPRKNRNDHSIYDQYFIWRTSGIYKGYSISKP